MLSIRYRFLSSQRSFKCELTSPPFCFKRGLSVLNTILETLTSFDSVFGDIARSTIYSAINFNDTSEFKSLVPTCTMKCPGSSLIDSFLKYSIHCIFAPGRLRTYTLHFFSLFGHLPTNKVLYHAVFWWWWWWWIVFVVVDRRKTFSLISSQDHCQRSPSLRISDTLRAGFKPAQNLSSGLVEWSCAVVITTTPRRRSLMWQQVFLFFSVLCLAFYLFLLLNSFSYFVDVYDHFQFSQSSYGFLLQHLCCLSHGQ